MRRRHREKGRAAQALGTGRGTWSSHAGLPMECLFCDWGKGTKRLFDGPSPTLGNIVPQVPNPERPDSLLYCGEDAHFVRKH